MVLSILKKHWHLLQKILFLQFETVLQHVFLAVVQFVQMRLPQHRYNEVWPEVMQDIMKVVTSGETIQRIGKVKNIPNQQVLVKQ